MTVILKPWEGRLQIKMKTNHISAESDPIPLYLPSVLPEVHRRKQTIQESGVIFFFFWENNKCFLKKKKSKIKKTAFISEIKEKPIGV